MDCDTALRKLRTALPDLRARYGVARIGVFGSVSRNTAGPESDVDLIVEFASGRAPGLAFFDLEEELAALLDAPVEIAALDRMSPRVRAAVERDLAYA